MNSSLPEAGGGFSLRSIFIVLRLVGYGFVGISAFKQSPGWTWLEWAVSASAVLWCIWDQWKKPDSPATVMRLGIAAETVLVLAWSFAVRDGIVLFALLSPLARSCIHLNWRDSCLLLLGELVAVALCSFYFHSNPTLQLVVLPVAGGYAFVLGMLLKQREHARRLAVVSAFERELRAQDEERIRVARQLHDRTGQYWSAVIRALDVAKRVDGERRIQFIDKAQEAAMEGLQEMRFAVSRWNDGLQTPGDWVRFMERSARRFGDILGIAVALDIPAIDWHRWDRPDAVAETIARTVIESMTNAVRHGHADTIGIRIEVGFEGIVITVQDDGVGFDPVTLSVREAGSGIRTMRELAQASGGSFAIKRGRNQGMTLTMRLPYRVEREEAAE